MTIGSNGNLFMTMPVMYSRKAIILSHSESWTREVCRAITSHNSEKGTAVLATRMASIATTLTWAVIELPGKSPPIWLSRSWSWGMTPVKARLTVFKKMSWSKPFFKGQTLMMKANHWTQGTSRSCSRLNQTSYLWAFLKGDPGKQAVAILQRRRRLSNTLEKSMV